MRVVQASVEAFQPAPRDDPWCYPGSAPPVHFVYDGGVHLLEAVEDLRELDEWLVRRGATPLGERYAVLCSGSNACPAQVQRKCSDLGGEHTTPFLRVRAGGIVAVYAAIIAEYGAIPATLERDPAAVAELFLALYTRAHLDVVIATERPEYYLAQLAPRITLPGGVRLPFVYAFVSRDGFLSLGGAEPWRLADHSQRELLERLFEQLGPAVDAPRLSDYLREPRAHRQGLLAAIRARGMVRPSSLPCLPVEEGALVPFGRVLAGAGGPG